MDGSVSIRIDKLFKGSKGVMLISSAVVTSLYCGSLFVKALDITSITVSQTVFLITNLHPFLTITSITTWMVGIIIWFIAAPPMIGNASPIPRESSNKEVYGWTNGAGCKDVLKKGLLKSSTSGKSTYLFDTKQEITRNSSICFLTAGS